MKRKRREKKKPEPIYVFPRDEDRIIIEGISAGSLTALAGYPEWKTREQLEVEARALLVRLEAEQQQKKHQPFTNDLAEMSRLYIPYYIGGFENAMQGYDAGDPCLAENNALFVDKGWQYVLNIQMKIIAENLASMKEDMKKFFPDL